MKKIISLLFFIFIFILNYSIKGQSIVITQQPKDTSVCEGAYFSFSVKASESGSLHYQWKKNNVNIPGATSSIYSKEITVLSDSGYYKCIVYNELDTIVSDSAFFRVKMIPKCLNSNPYTSNYLYKGQNGYILLDCIGEPPITYQWYKENNIMQGQTNNLIYVNNLKYRTSYKCKISNICSSYDKLCMLDINNNNIINIIKIGSISAIPENDILIPVTVVNSESLWGFTIEILYDNNVIDYLSTININSQISDNLDISYNNKRIVYKWNALNNKINFSNVDLFYIKFRYKGGNSNISFNLFDCEFYHTYNIIYAVNYIDGSIKKADHKLSITKQPVSTIRCINDSLNFSLEAQSYYPVSYQWYKESNLLQDATNSVLKIKNISVSDTGYYYCRVSNDSMSLNSEKAHLEFLEFSKVVLNYKGDINICPGDKIELSATGKENINYQWYFNDNVINNATTTSYLASSQGVYKLKFSDECHSFFSDPVNIKYKYTGNISVTDGKRCGKGEVILTAKVDTGTIYWYKKDDLINPYAVDTDTIKLELNQTTYFYVKTNVDGCEGPAMSVTAKIYPLPDSTIYYNKIICKNYISLCGDSIAEIYTKNNNNLYQWFANDTAIEGATQYKYNASKTGVSYKVKIINVYKCQTISNPVILGALKKPIVVLNYKGDINICPGSTIELSATKVENISYQWYFNDNVIYNATNTSYLASTQGVYKLKFSDEYCSFFSDTVNIKYKYTGNISVTDGKRCGKGEVILTAKVDTGTIYWYKKDDLINPYAVDTDTIKLELNQTTYFYVKTNLDGCEGPAMSVTANIYPLPDSTIYNNDSICKNYISLCEDATIELYTNNNNNLYQWFANDTAIEGATKNIYKASKPGVSYKVKIINLYKCQTTSIPIFFIGKKKPVINFPLDTFLTTMDTLVLDAGKNDTNNTYTYSWAIPKSIPAPILTSRYLTLFGPQIKQGYYNLNITATDTNGCFEKKDCKINVYDYYKISNFSLETKGAKKGDTVDIYMTASYFKNVGALGIKVKYDTTNLRFLNVTSKNPILNSQMLYADINGLISIAFASYNPEEIITNLDTIFKYKFILKGGISNLIFDKQVSCIGVSETPSTTEKILVNYKDGMIYEKNYSVEGTVNYDNDSNSPLSGIKLILYNKDYIKVDSTFTDNSGNFRFSGLDCVNYIIKAYTSIKADAGTITPIDALFISRCFIKLYLFKDDLKNIAADVDNNNIISPVDALFVNRFYLKYIDNMPKGNWYFETKSFEINFNNVVVKIKGIHYGDVDGSFK